MKILVCITSVPDTTSKIEFVDNKLKKDSIQFIIGPYDEYALSKAVDIKNELDGVEITALNVGLSENDTIIRKALAIGADKAIRINSEPKSSRQVSDLISDYLKDNKFDLILMGKESIDYNSSIVHGLVANELNLPYANSVMKLDIKDNVANFEQEIPGGKRLCEVHLPVILGVQEPIAEWKIPSMRGIMSARTKPLDVIEPTVIGKYDTIEEQTSIPPRGECKIVESTDELVDLLRKEAKII